MSYRFDNKVILITGAASGIGRATAKRLASLGATLALSDINETSLAETAALCEGQHFKSVFDVGSTDGSNKFVADIIARFGRLDHVFNCAGVNPTAYPTEEVTDAYWDKLVNTNLKGVFNITRATIPHMKEGSSFVNVSSISGLQPTAMHATYCATKYGVIGFSKCMALELGPKGIRTNIIAPGSVITPTNAGILAGEEAVKSMIERAALKRLGTPEEIADVVAFLFSNEARYMNGSVVEVNGGMNY